MKPSIIDISRKNVQPIVDGLRQEHPEIFQIHSHTNQWEKALIYKLCEQLPDNSIIVELGAHLGATSLTIGLAIENKKGCEVYCVDTWDNRNMPGEPPISIEDWLKNTISVDVNAWKGETKDIGQTYAQARELSGEGISLIFFDADHSYEGITGDIKAWLPSCNHGCWLVFHDYGGKYGRPAIQQAVSELIWPVQDGPGYMLESIYYCKLGHKNGREEK